MPKYDSWNSSDAVDRSLLDNDIHYLNGEINSDNVSEAIKWILSANLTKNRKEHLNFILTPQVEISMRCLLLLML